MLTLHEHHGLSHRKLADLFNQLYFAETGVSVGRTWVRELLIKEAHRALHRQRELKHCVPARLPSNRLWGIDTTCVTDAKGGQHIDGQSPGVPQPSGRTGVAVLRRRPASFASARPWENGHIERLFGTFKRCLADHVIRDGFHLREALPAFQFWYNVARPHQHLCGHTPQQAWLGIDPLKTAPRSVLAFCAWGGRLRGMVLRH